MLKSKDLIVGEQYTMRGEHPVYPKAKYDCKILAEYPRYFLCKIQGRNLFSTSYKYCIQKVDIDTGLVEMRY